MKRYWIGIASKEHVKMGVAGGFSQLCHGKAQPLRRMAVGDGLIYYSAKETFGTDVLCQQFTAIGELLAAWSIPSRCSLVLCRIVATSAFSPPGIFPSAH